MSIEFLFRRINQYGDKDAIVWKDQSYSFLWLANAISDWQQKLSDSGISSGNVVVVRADFSPNAIALFLALAREKCVVVPLASAVTQDENTLLKTAMCEYGIFIDSNDDFQIKPLPFKGAHEYYDRLIDAGHPGLVLFSSGSTGPSKAAVHDLQFIIDKFRKTRKALRSIAFLLYDHIGGINTMLYLLVNGGCLVAVDDRNPDTVLKIIEKHRVELLPTSPTFLNLILLSGAYQRYDLSPLKIVTYGTEPMPESTLKRFHQILPHIDLRQTYGLSEIGIMQSKSKGSDSLWFKIGGTGYETRIVDGILHVKARSAMLGYLNHPNPFTEDGWLITGDRVEQNGEYLRIIGRESEIINVGGEKVHPVAIESILQSMENVADATVYGKDNAITGQMVCADVRLAAFEDKKTFIRRLKEFCREHMMPYMIPVKINLVDQSSHSARFKKVRSIYA